MPFIRSMTNLEIFSDRYDKIVRYAPLLRCPSCGNSPYLACVQGTCVARPMRLADECRRTTVTRPTGLRPVLTGLRGKRSTHTGENRNLSSAQTHEEAISTLDKSYVNTFMLMVVTHQRNGFI